MKRLLVFAPILIVFLSNCQEAKQTSATNKTPEQTLDTIKIPKVFVEKSFLEYKNSTSQWFLNNELYSGYIIVRYSDGTIKEKTSVFNGKRQFKSFHWYKDTHFKRKENYHLGKLHGEKKTWSSDPPHLLIAHYHYHLGKVHGEQTQWYPTGELYKKMNLNMGKEEGIQQAFRKNGYLYTNYEAKNGRTFGLKKTSLCYGVENEKIKYAK